MHYVSRELAQQLTDVENVLLIIKKTALLILKNSRFKHLDVQLQHTYMYICIFDQYVSYHL